MECTKYSTMTERIGRIDEATTAMTRTVAPIRDSEKKATGH
jgi:hypothetical protein